MKLRESLEVMDEVIEIEGASGRLYRFIRGGSAPTPSDAGNFVFMAEENPSTVVCSGTTADLSVAVKFWHGIPRHEAETLFYIRRNVTKTMRQVEHEDICLKHAPEMVVFEFDGSS